LFLAKRYQEIFSRLELNSFDKLWAKKIDWFEEPNHKRGGWSGVGHVLLESGQDKLDVFIKKQKNHGRKTILHPKTGEPTFRREFKRLQFLEKHGVNAAKVIFYDEQHQNSDKAILITEALVDYKSLETVLLEESLDKKLSLSQRRRLIKNVATLLRDFHETGLQHRALYSKHVFVKSIEKNPEIALIDLEKARVNLFLLRRAYYDLSQLNRNIQYVTKSERLYFLLQYFRTNQLNWRLKKLCKQLIKRSKR